MSARLRSVIFGVVLTLAVAYGGWRVWKDFHPSTTTTVISPSTTTTQVDSPDLGFWDLTRGADPRDKDVIRALYDENVRLKSTITAMSKTLATLESTGTGPVSQVEIPPSFVTETSPLVSHMVETPATTKGLEYRDWRLHFLTDGQTAKYELTQKFEVLSTTGRNEAGVPVALTNVFELGPNGERTPLTDVKTTFLVADQTKVRWRFGFSVPGGVAVTYQSGKRQIGGVVGAQLLSRGRSRAAGDMSMAVLTPVIYASETSQEFGVLPLSVNLGNVVKHQPFQNLWVSPLFTMDGKYKLSRWGFTFTAIF